MWVAPPLSLLAYSPSVVEVAVSSWKPNLGEINRTKIEFARAKVSRYNRETTNLAKYRAPRRTGLMANSIGSSMRVSSFSIRGKVGTRVKYAAVQNDGSRPHVIRARRKKALRFYWERVGRTVVFREVSHPGTGATQFLTSAGADAARRNGFRWTRNLSTSLVTPTL